jgi:serine-type D-Ala-D-Ala carboxypeptidase (penicillin-binding protein 5/6)
MNRSNFSVAHGMHNDSNYSTAKDIGKMCCHMMQNEDFRDIVITQTYDSASKVFPGHVYKWENTNQLLKEGFSGIKTGITPTAGPCLAASFQKDSIEVVVIVLSCCSMESRWYEVPKLIQWGLKKINKIKQSNLKSKLKQKILKNITYI